MTVAEATIRRSTAQRAQQVRDRAIAIAKARTAILAMQIRDRHPQFTGMVASEIIDGYRSLVERECGLWMAAERYMTIGCRRS